MRVDNGGVGIEFEVTGSGPPVLLVHGFPDSSRIWREQVLVLAGAGFSVIVPDMRGCGASDQPIGTEPYAVHHLSGDLLAILDSLGHERAHIVGHDWGSAISWATAIIAPERVERLVALSVGHPSSFYTAGMEQMMRSWYMLLFLHEGVAEEWLSVNDWANLRAWGDHPDIDEVVAEFERNGSLTPMLNWYRANFSPRAWVDPPIDLPPVTAPTMGVWSDGDAALTERQMEGSGNYVEAPWRYERIEGAGHWLQLEATEQVNRLLLDFLAD
jgi:pimeloyl-ACP methyl ester carboxylesterase